MMHPHCLIGVSRDLYASLAAATALLDWKTGSNLNQDSMVSYIPEGIGVYTS